MTQEQTNNRKDCPSLQELYEYLYGKIRKKERAAISSHVSACPYCEDELHELREFVGENPEDEFNEYYTTHRLDKSPLPERIYTLVQEFAVQGTTGSQMFKERLYLLIEGIKRLKPAVSFQLPISALDPLTTRGAEQSKDVIDANDTIIIILEPPVEEEVFLTVFHYDEQNNLQMILPENRNDNISIRAGEIRTLTVDPVKSKGKHYLKAIFTSKPLINPYKIDFEDDLDVATAIGNYLKSIRNLGSAEWWEAVAEFQIA